MNLELKVKKRIELKSYEPKMAAGCSIHFLGQDDQACCGNDFLTRHSI